MQRNLGAGDKRTRRGKISKGSYGNSRPHTARKALPPTPKAGARRPR
ncbi:MAG: 30S ribosomal protein THX [Burkholderiales bacterium]|nr:30S ribosomal protein THX [Burkholderiales bacterium]